MNYLQECWDFDNIITSIAPYGRFVVWNRQSSNKVRLMVKVRASDVDRIHCILVVLHNTIYHDHGDSCSCPTYIIKMNMLGVGPSGFEIYFDWQATRG
jgi:hypothetical protein